MKRFWHIANKITVAFCIIAALGVTTACVSITPKTRISSARPKKISATDRATLSKLAQKALGRSSITTPKRSFRADCSGMVRGIFHQAQIPLGGVIKSSADNDVKAIYRYVRKYGEIVKTNPLPGDLVFFHNTYDRSKNGQMNDALTHIGIVEKVQGNLVYFIHHLGRTIIRSRMDLSRPTLSIDEKSNNRINHVLRRAQNGYRAYTAAELFAGFGRL